MTQPRLLYISINDGSDTRINKEIQTLAAHFEITYLGIGKSTDQSFAQTHCKHFHLVKGHHKSPFTFLKYYLLVVQKCLFHSYQSIHIINENLLLLFLPWLWWSRHKLVLDVFDSIFLRAKNKNSWLQSLSYQTPKTIIVTDSNRKALLPESFHHKTVVVENYPYFFARTVPKISQANELVLFYNGSMSKVRGSELLLRLVTLSRQVKIKMAGWIYDDFTRQLAEHPQVEFLGVLPQSETMQVAAQCDYIVSMYEPVNENNINASPNKIYDAIQAGTSVLINREVKIASFVEQEKIGYILESFYATDDASLVQDLLAQKQSFHFDGKLRNTYTWEAIENKLIHAHQA